MKRAILAAVAALTLGAPAALASEGELAAQSWSFDGVFGQYDRNAMQRGFQVYKEVCAACHALKYVAFRNLADLGFNEDEIKAIAAEYQIEDGPDDAGDMFSRPARPSDPFPAPFANDQAARASNNGAIPPNLSLITKARASGSDYLYALLTGYREPPADMAMGEGMNYNMAMPGNQIAMPQPLTEGQVTFADGTPATVEQMSRDVVQFLAWAAEPKLEERKNAGVKSMLFLLALTGLLYAAKRKVWSKLH